MTELKETPKSKLPTDAKSRKDAPMARGLLDYFPAACAAVAELSRIGNEQHNPGQPMHWAREKSTDHADCIVRHLIERGEFDTDGVRHSAKVAWRALAMLQVEIEDAATQQRVVGKSPLLDVLYVASPAKWSDKSLNFETVMALAGWLRNSEWDHGEKIAEEMTALLSAPWHGKSRVRDDEIVLYQEDGPARRFYMDKEGCIRPLADRPPDALVTDCIRVFEANAAKPHPALADIQPSELSPADTEYLRKDLPSTDANENTAENIPSPPLTPAREEFTPTRTQQEQEEQVFKAGDKVRVKGTWSKATVAGVNSDGRYTLCYPLGGVANYKWAADELERVEQ